MDDFAGLCRLCLKPSHQKMVNVTHFDDLIALLGRVKLVKHPMIPHKVCQNCSSILIAAGMLRVNCVESNKFFLNYLNENGLEPLSLEAAEEWETELELTEADQEVEEYEHQVKEETEVEVEDEVILDFMPEEVEVHRRKITPLPESCRLCLVTFQTLPGENSISFMKEMIKRVLTLKKYNGQAPDKLCDDCLGKLMTASTIAEKCQEAYEYFHSKDSIIITTATCWVCLKGFQNDSDICTMSSMTYSYMHYLATRNTDQANSELSGDRRICLKCMHDLEVANAVRYRNWKTESLLDSRHGFKQMSRTERSYDPWYVNNNDDNDTSDIEKEISRPLNAPPTAQTVDCQYCLKQFPTESNMRRHIELDHIPTATECDQCGAKLVNERSLRVHYLTVHMRFVEAICDICGNIYHSANKLAKHRVIHFEDRNVPCTLCPAKFKRKENLKIHMRVHTGVKPFKCPFCEKKYAHHSDCKRHVATHTGKYPIHCGNCGQGFVKKSELMAHEEKHLKDSEKLGVLPHI